jgi:AcrR family transcriptional regulator
MNNRRGRPSGHPDTKARIAAAGRDLFLRRGYRATTVRAVAAAAGVDSALIGYHFGSKQGLFAQALDLSCVAPGALDVALTGDRAGLADRLLTAVLTLWDANSPAAHRLAAQDTDTMRALRDYLERELIPRLAEFLGGPDATGRAAAAVTILAGVIFTRYLNPIRPLATQAAADIRSRLAGPLRMALGSVRAPLRDPSSPLLSGDPGPRARPA